MKRLLILILLVFAVASLVSAGSYVRKYDHIQTAALTYSSTLLEHAEFLANNLDLVINPADDLYDDIFEYDSIRCGYPSSHPDTSLRAITYATFSCIIMSDAMDTGSLNQFCRDESYDTADFYMWADEGTITITNGEARTADPGEIVQVLAAGHTRRILDVRNQYLGDWIWYHLSVVEQAEHGARNYSGFMEDEAFLLKSSIWGQITGNVTWPTKDNMWTTGTPSDANGWDAFTSTPTTANLLPIQDSLIKLKHEVYDWPSRLADSLEEYDYLFFRNPANYMCFEGFPGSAYGTSDYETEGYMGLGYLLGEYVFMNPTAAGGSATEATELAYLNMITTYTVSGIRNIFWVYVIPTDTVALGGNSHRRAQYERLCLYYMGADPDLTWFMITDNRGPPHRPNGWESADDDYLRPVMTPKANRTPLGRGLSPGRGFYGVVKKTMQIQIIAPQQQ